MSAVERFSVGDTSQVQKDRVVGPKGRTFSQWSLKELNETLYLTYIYDKVMEDVLQEVTNAAARAVSLKSKGTFFAINPTNSFNAIMGEVFKASDIALPILKKAETVAREWIEARRGLGRLVFVDSGVIIPGQNAFLFEYGSSEDLLKQKQNELCIDALGYLFAQLPVESLGPTSYSEEDLAFLGQEKDLLPNPEQLTCFQYAFLKMQEPEARCDICADKEIRPSLGSLIEWGYENVETPDEGDLVVYISPDMKIHHLGIYTKDNRVESKWGFKRKETYRHQPFDVPFNYGKTVVFMRKSLANLLD